MNLIEIFSIIIIHWFADFVLQSDEDAKNKSKSNKHLTSHVLTYTAVWSIIGLWYGLYYNQHLLGALFPIITFVFHWITDYYTSRLNSKLWSEGKVHNFFVSVGFDQVLHYVQLFTTYYYLKTL